MEPIVAIIGTGYVGLISALNFSKLGLKVIAFDINEQRIKELSSGVDSNQEIAKINRKNLVFTSDVSQLREAHYFLISVPTPLNIHQIPDLRALKSAAKLVGGILKKNDVVILESTVFPGATRELLIPILNKKSGLKCGQDFFVGYSSERIVPGDERLTELNTSTKVISGESAQALKKIEKLYRKIPGLKLYCASSLEVAESSKLLENIQRNVNIALMNEFAQIMDKMNISFHDVFEAAKTKSNFIPFTPGLVGGHCIPEDPHYLIYQANKLDCVHNLISCACQVNQQFYQFIMNVAINLLIKQRMPLHSANIAILGMSFKANVNDIRHSLSTNLYYNFKDLGINIIACDPLVTPEKINLNWVSLEDLSECQAIILCQAHKEFKELGAERLAKKLVPNGVLIDIPGAFAESAYFRKDIAYWKL
jgi:UDP-N-acetyl-D-galactosamine dehydrogenase